MGERLYEESIGEVRDSIDMYLRKFEDILETQDRSKIEKAAKELKEILQSISEDGYKY